MYVEMLIFRDFSLPQKYRFTNYYVVFVPMNISPNTNSINQIAYDVVPRILFSYVRFRNCNIITIIAQEKYIYIFFSILFIYYFGRRG